MKRLAGLVACLLGVVGMLLGVVSAFYVYQGQTWADETVEEVSEKIDGGLKTAGDKSNEIRGHIVRTREFAASINKTAKRPTTMRRSARRKCHHFLNLVCLGLRDIGISSNEDKSAIAASGLGGTISIVPSWLCESCSCSCTVLVPSPEADFFVIVRVVAVLLVGL